MIDDIKVCVFELKKEPGEKSLQDFVAIKDILEQYGVLMKLEDGYDGEPNKTLIISCGMEMIQRKTTRNAGRKQKYVYKETTVAEIRERMKTEKAENIAKELGLSRATLFRKIKWAEENGFEELT